MDTIFRTARVSAGIFLFLIVATVAYAALLFSDSLPPVLSEWVSDVAWSVFSLMAMWQSFRASRIVTSKNLKRAWLWFAIGAMAWFLAMVWWDVLYLALGQTFAFPLAYDALFSALAPCFVLGMFYYMRNTRGSDFYKILIGDIGMIFVATVAGLLILLVVPIAQSNEPPLYIFTALFHGFFSVAAAIFALFCYWFYLPTRSHNVFVFMLLAVIGHAIADTAYAFLLLGHSFSASSSINILWLIAFALQYWAATQEIEHSKIPREKQVTDLSPAQWSKWEFIIPSVSLTAVSAIAFGQKELLHAELLLPLAGCGIIFAAFLFYRAWAAHFYLSNLQQMVWASEHLNKAVLDAIPDLVWVKDTKGVYLACNPQFEQFFGATEAEIVGRTDYDFVDKNLADFFRAHDLAALHKNSPTINEEKITFAIDGQERFIETIKTPLRDDSGHILGVLGIGRDITERKAHEQTLQEREERYRSVITTANDGFWMLDVQGHLLDVNDAYIQRSGYSRDELMAMTIADLDASESPEKVNQHIQNIIRNGSALFTSHHRSKSGEIWPVEVSISYMVREGGRFVAFIRDISERRQAEERLLQAKKFAEKANRAKSDFLASMSHELRTPLNAVLGFAQLLQFNPKAPLSSLQNEYVENILEGGNHLLELVNQVLDLAKIEADQISIALLEVNPRVVLEECIEFMKPLAMPHNVQISCSCTRDSLPYLRTDQTRFKQIILNLLSNAIRYNQDNGSVTITGNTTAEGYLRICISDQGLGIARDDYPGVFQLFNRLNADAMIAKEGTGIGLPVTKMLVERLSGRIGFDSELGKGSTFWVELPLASNTDVLIWAENLRIGVDAIDKDHQTLIMLTNRLSDPCVDDEDLKDVVTELVVYTQHHFRREEAIMSACDYPDFEAHQKVHISLSNRVQQLADEWYEAHTADALKALRKFMREWLIDHVSKTDMEISHYTQGKKQAIEKALHKIQMSLSTR